MPDRWRSPPLPRWAQPFSSVSVRLVTIILLAVVPIGVLGALMAYHTYVATIDASSVRASVVGQTLRAQLEQRVSDARRMMREVAASPQIADALSTDRCAAYLETALQLQTVSLRNIALLDAHGATVCSAGGRAVSPSPGSTAYPVDRQPVSRLAVPIELDGHPMTLAGNLAFGWSRADLADAELWRAAAGGGGTAAWLIPPHGEPIPLCPDCDWTRTTYDHPAVDQANEGRSMQRNAVAGYDLLVVTQPSRAEQRALALFLWRVAAIAVLLLSGFLIVMIGANALIVAPLRAVTRSVRHWREEGAYSPIQTLATPIELQQLSRAFADATRVVAAHEERLKKAEIKQELLIKEIHHRVKNNLQIIASLLNLQANRIRQPEARAEFASARDRVRALATLHRHLYSEGELHTLNMKSFLEELCGQLFQAIGEKEGRRIRLEIDAPELVMSTDQAVPLALVVTEAVSNAIKYAFPGGRSGLVSVRLTEDAPGSATLVIQDDGIGIPAGRAETETGIRDGLGIQLIRGFAAQLGATLQVVEGTPDEQGQSAGTCYTLVVPLHPKGSDVGSDDDGMEDQKAPKRTDAKR